MKFVPMEFGMKIRSARRGARITQADLAMRVGVHPLTVMKWEQGRDTPRVAHLHALCTTLDIDANRLIGVRA
jgi:transcriptional regulator with XRE-family HTH domain